MNRWIDIHSHILPAVDDGSVNLDQTRNMLRIAFEEGIHVMIATPHYGVGCRNTDKEELEKKLNLVRAEAAFIDKELRIEIGNELYYSEDITEHLRKNKALTLAGTRYVLVEFARDADYQTIRTGLHRLLIYGYYPILAHVERYESLYMNFKEILALTELGAYIQMNISSVVTKDRKTKFCRQLIEYDLIHILSTDCHSDCIRAPRLREGLTLIRKKYGETVLHNLLSDNAQKLLNNQSI